MQLISSDRCPFVQRSIVTLEYKSVPYEVIYLDPYDPPAWFTEISPTGKVPVLKLDDGTVLFESAVINEYLDEITPGQMHPTEPLQKALNRSWIEFGSQCLAATFQIMTADSEAGFTEVRDRLEDNLLQLQAASGDGPFFNGPEFALVDAAFAPLFVRLEILKDLTGVDFLGDKPRLLSWHRAMTELDAVKTIIRPELRDRFDELMQSRNAWILKTVA